MDAVTLQGFVFIVMTQLIKVKEKEGKQVVSARELHEFLGFDKSQWSRWSKKNIIENQFSIEREDWVRLDIVSNHQKTTDYAISLDFAKRISMMARTKEGEKARLYFIECEKQINQPKELSRMEILSLAMEAEKEKIALQQSNEKLQIELDEHKAWYSVKRVCLLGYFKSSESKALWRKLKKYSIEHDYQIKSIFDANYGNVKTYHKDVWLNVYGVKL